jgi:hypothetical protein
VKLPAAGVVAPMTVLFRPVLVMETTPVVFTPILHESFVVLYDRYPRARVDGVETTNAPLASVRVWRLHDAAAALAKTATSFAFHVGAATAVPRLTNVAGAEPPPFTVTVVASS